ncbi:MAG: hypothetical protein LBJ67_18855 [Planctomycetaceae bacterium]|jgi:hypothetical protein|nr:hypothetical protein [Planctomycetaceae bacterium]
MKSTICSSAVCLALTLIFIIGCGGTKKPDGFPQLISHTVIVNNNGKPEKDVTIVLLPQDVSGSWAVSGTTDSSGKAILATSQGSYTQSGCPAGKYKTVLTKNVRPSFEVSSEEYDKMTDAQRAEYGVKMKAEMKKLSVIVPQSLTSPTTTKLIVDVSDSNKEVSVDLKDYK